MKIQMIYWLAIVFVVAHAASAESRPRYADPSVFEVNREPAHAFSHVFPGVKSARPEPDWNNPFANSDRYLMLNGEWKFKWTENIATAPKDFFTSSYDSSGWDQIQVPLPWQMADYGQIYYYNCRMPMLIDRRNLSEDAPPEVEGVMDVTSPKIHGGARQREAAKRGYIPEQWNPVGSYVTEFTVPAHWKGMRTVLHFSGVKSGFTCWVNGKEVGYSQDSFTPAEFDITKYLKTGRNHLAVQVIRWTDGAYLENQDRIRLSGIIRDVYLFATPKAHIGDFFVRQKLNDTFDRAELEINVALRNAGSATAASRSVEVELIDPQGRTVGAADARFPNVSAANTALATCSLQLAAPQLWHTEEPNLYTALIKLLDDDNVTEVIRQDVGFRRFDWDEKGNTRLNGKRYYMRGVNRSDCSPETGYYVDYADMLKDALTMKELNIDSVRTSHNPNDIRWYAICNRLGITLVDEANVESHQHDTIFQSDSESEEPWRVQSVWRMRNMVERDKNQPSVIIWSIGNEQFPRGEEVPAIKAMYDATKAIDPTRGVICERTYQQGTGENCAPFLDLLAPMYGGEQSYVKHYEAGEERRPFFLSEYAHAMGNSHIDIKKKWTYFEDHDGLNGGHIWDWRDQSVYYPLPGLKGRHLTYGGDWSKHTGNDGTFCMNGIVLPDHRFTGKSFEAKAAYQQVEFLPSDTFGKVRLKNKFATRNLDEFDFKVTLVKGGIELKSRGIEVSLDPLSETELPVPFDISRLDPTSGCHLNYEVSWKEKKPWADKGAVFARGQVELQKGRRTTETLSLDGTVRFSESDDKILVTAGEVVIEFDKKKTLLTQIISDGKKLLAPDDTLAGIELNLNFHPTDDFNKWGIPRMREFLAKKHNMLKREAGSLSVRENSASRVVVEAENRYLLPGGKSGYLHKSTCTVMPSGVMQIDNYVKEFGVSEKNFVLRIGTRIPVAKPFEKSTYLAYGPNENYVGRRAWERYGVHEHNAMDFFSQYVRPQECGNRSGLKWIALQDRNGIGLEVAGEKTANGSVMPWTAEQFASAAHIPQLPESTRWIMRYDAELPGISKWAAYFIKGDYRFSYSIRPLGRGADAAQAAIPLVSGSMKMKAGAAKKEK